jgi:hypothetical protein
MPKATRKSATSVRALVKRINSDPEERLRFLHDPSEALSKVGIVPSAKAKKELQTLIREFLKTYPEMALLPTGLSRTGGGKAGGRAGGGPGGGPERMFIG